MPHKGPIVDKMDVFWAKDLEVDLTPDLRRKAKE
jgi:hypothetical protein